MKYDFAQSLLDTQKATGIQYLEEAFIAKHKKEKEQCIKIMTYGGK